MATVELNENLLKAMKKKCSQAQVVISHHSIINEFKYILGITDEQAKEN